MAQWEEHEEAVLQHLKEKNVDNERQLEDEPPGIDELLEVQVNTGCWLARTMACCFRPGMSVTEYCWRECDGTT